MKAPGPRWRTAGKIALALALGIIAIPFVLLTLLLSVSEARRG